LVRGILKYREARQKVRQRLWALLQKSLSTRQKGNPKGMPPFWKNTEAKQQRENTCMRDFTGPFDRRF
jgi:hypothetical protein